MDNLFLPGVAFDNYGQIADPAAGANYTDITLFGAGTRYQLIALSFTLTTDATAGTRRVQLVWRFDHTSLTEQELICCQAQVAQEPSTAVRYFVAPGYADSATIVDLRCLIRMPFPLELWVPSGAGTGWTMDSDVDGMVAGDQLSNARFWCRIARGAPL